MTQVAVTGIGVVSGFGIGVAPFWEGLLAGRRGLSPLEHYAAIGAPLVGAVAGLDVRTFATTPGARRIDRTSLLALAACRLAISDASGLPLRTDSAAWGLAVQGGISGRSWRARGRT